MSGIRSFEDMGELQVFFDSPVASTIMVITIITSIRAFNDPALKARLMLRPFDAVRNKDWKQLLTSGLVHANGMHLAFNMLAFYFFAFVLEQWIGHWQFALLYVVSLVVSDLPTLWKNRNNPAYASLGASGAVSAVVLSVVMFNPEIGIGLLFIPGYIPGWIFALLYLGFSIFASYKQWGNVNHDAHFWGAISGIILTLILAPQVIDSLRVWMETF